MIELHHALDNRLPKSNGEVSKATPGFQDLLRSFTTDLLRFVVPKLTLLIESSSLSYQTPPRVYKVVVQCPSDHKPGRHPRSFSL
jgi:hypothetical protein